MFRFVILNLICILFFLTHSVGQESGRMPNSPHYFQQRSHWVDSVMSSMSLKQKIGQLIMMEVYSNQDAAYEAEVSEKIRAYQPGTLIFFQGGPVRQIRLLNRWQPMSKIPMLIAMDAEWGVSMRLDSVISFPRLMCLAATGDTALIFRYGQMIGYQCKRMGVHIDFAPVVDVNNNPLNPVINYRSFGENQHLVSLYARCFVRGMRSQNVMCVLKHFPGHGNTDVDSHKDLPVVNDSRAVLDSIHLLPYREMVNDDVWGVMVAHLFVPALDSAVNLPSSLSNKIINGLLRREIGFHGLVITDALQMQGVAKDRKPGAVAVSALQAGNDLLCMPGDIKAAIDSIATAVDSGRLSHGQIDSSVRKVLETKYDEGLVRWNPVSSVNVYADLNNQQSLLFKKNVYRKASTLLKNDGLILPLAPADKRIACVSYYTEGPTLFHRTMDRYVRSSNYYIPDPEDTAVLRKVTDTLKNFDMAIVGIHRMSFLVKGNYKFNALVWKQIKKMNLRVPMILALFGNPYALQITGSDPLPQALIIGYERDSLVEEVVAEGIFGARGFMGHLPVSPGAGFKAGDGMITSPLNVIVESDYEDSDADTIYLNKIDSIIARSIADSVFPGCQVLAVHKGKVIYNVAAGFHTYDKSAPVLKSDIYDLASVTKVLATTLGVMKLYEMSWIDVEDFLGQHLPMVKGTALEKLSIRSIMAHVAGLRPWIPFYASTMTNGKPDTNIYHRVADSIFCIPIADSMFMRRDQTDSLVSRIVHSRVDPDQGYKYSDLDFYLMAFMVEALTGKRIDDYCEEMFYKPLGLNNTLFNPLSRIPRCRIVPTELDTTFRMQLIQGYVHDQGAAMMGGVAGHAGLFSNAWDMAVILQMLMQGGTYAGKSYFRPETIKLFTSWQYPKIRRGLGFDKPPQAKGQSSPCCPEASNASYGHSGFTGTFFWCDPESDLIYVFLSNRVNPTSNNDKLVKRNVRTEIQSLLYQSIAH